MNNTEKLLTEILSLDKLNLLPDNLVVSLILERKQVYLEHGKDASKIKPAIKAINKKYLDMDVVFKEPTVTLDSGEVVTGAKVAKDYLDQTDWYEVRLISRKVDIPDKVISLRTQAIGILNTPE